eukprot:CAMPEP_0168738134 /NCGR_PEP_ID=MMETSP0724-20121128/10770_1 /TAXON_ID=265536 /ORGANISM="Amphiprora sp., Strain CCMP467" /LENGTH=368 /DNA_ID=CAMNT_0008785455 /DNA_START=202 /DNA_END=1304 /DNA_ORIENTATION=+
MFRMQRIAPLRPLRSKMARDSAFASRRSTEMLAISHLSSNARALSSLSPCDSGHGHWSSWDMNRLASGAGLLMSSGLWISSAQNHSSITNCEAAPEQKPGDNRNGQGLTEEEEEEDPYANLPEEDEPTDCSMCNTFRQGPCRPPWRKLERCFKDHENEEGGATKCMKYFLPHQECLMKYINLYDLVGQEMKQELISDIEQSFSKDERHQIPMPGIDWSLYHEFLKEQGPSFRQTIPNLPPETPLWKRLPPETEPVLISLQTELPKTYKRLSGKDNGWILKVAYVVDQDGKVLGFQYSEAYSDLLKISHGDKPEKETSLEDPLKVRLVIMPGETKSIQIKAFYSENPLEAKADKEILDGCICESPLTAV